MSELRITVSCDHVDSSGRECNSYNFKTIEYGDDIAEEFAEIEWEITEDEILCPRHGDITVISADC